LLVISKLDLPEARERFEELRAEFPELLGMSAATGEGVRELVYATWEALKAAPPPEAVRPEPAHVTLRQQEPFEIHVDAGVYVVTGERIERLAAMTDFDSEEALARFESVLARLGVDERLRAMGAHDGDTVRIAGTEFTYS
jgi:GTP-binding protein